MGRPFTNCKRSEKSPAPGTKVSYKGASGVGTPDKQYKQSGPKYSGPNYPQSQNKNDGLGKGAGKVIPFNGK